jgi:hypothetical protein
MNSKIVGLCSAHLLLVASVGPGFADPIATVAQAGASDWVRHAVTLPESIWSVAAVDANADGKLDLIAMGEKAVDLDGDGRLDLILAVRKTRNAVWYQNRQSR